MKNIEDFKFGHNIYYKSDDYYHEFEVINNNFLLKNFVIKNNSATYVDSNLNNNLKNALDGCGIFYKIFFIFTNNLI